MKQPRMVRALDAISQLGNVLIFDGEANYSISGDAHRLGRERLEAKIDWVFARLPFGLAEEEHCRKSYWADVARAYELTGSING